MYRGIKLIRKSVSTFCLKVGLLPEKWLVYLIQVMIINQWSRFLENVVINYSNVVAN